MTMPFVVTRCQHRAFGSQVKVQFACELALRLTLPEASSLSLALIAVRDGISPEREIYMSPIASDAAFAGTVHDRGISVATSDGAIELDWPQVGLLAEAMACAIG
jgi:hypothetical protein